MSSSSSSEGGNGVVGYVARRSGGDFEGSSSSRQRVLNEVWPEPFLDALATQVALDASLSIGRLAAAPALANVFQVCSTWRAISHSNLLWHRLTRSVWGRTHLLHATWHDEYVYRHRTARNFRTGRYAHFTLQFDPSDVDDLDGLACRCLTLSDHHLACGFADGTVRLFDLATRLHFRTYRPHHGDRFGRYSRAVSGIVITDARVVFGTMDGDIYVALLDGVGHPRRAHLGNVVNDGALVDFTGCGRWWVGLYAGVPDRAFHIWDSNTEEPVFVGLSLTNLDSVEGWHMFNEFAEFVGRVRVTSQETAVACTSRRMIVFNISDQGVVVLGEEEYTRGLIVTSVDVNNEAYVIVVTRGFAIVRRAHTLEEVYRFRVAVASQWDVMGCMNLGYALICVAGVTGVREVEHGEYLYSFREILGGVNAMVADDRHVIAASGCDNSIHLWDFGAQ